MRSSLVLLAVLLLAPAAHANGFDRPAPPLAELLARSRAAKKPLLLDFSAVWCQPCKLLDAELDKPENQKRLERFVFQAYDAERGAGAEAAAKFAVTGYPTLVVVDENGAVMGQKVGFDSDGISAWLEAQAQALRSEAELEAQLRAKPDDVDAMWLLERVEVLEPSASPKLRRCIDKAVRAIAVPADQKATKVIVPIKMGA